MVTKQCEVCGKIFEAKTIRSKYCTACAIKVNREKSTEWRMKYAPAPQRYCQTCGKSIGQRKWYCEECLKKRCTEKHKNNRIARENKKQNFEDTVKNCKELLSGIDISKYMAKK